MSPGPAAGWEPATTRCRNGRGTRFGRELDVADRHLTVLECRVPWRAGSRAEWTRFPIVRFHYVKARREWSTYWRDRNLKFHRYDPFPPTSALDDLLAAVDADRSGIFWG